jgi:hypothetical protein
MSLDTKLVKHAFVNLQKDLIDSIMNRISSETLYSLVKISNEMKESILNNPKISSLLVLHLANSLIYFLCLIRSEDMYNISKLLSRNKDVLSQDDKTNILLSIASCITQNREGMKNLDKRIIYNLIYPDIIQTIFQEGKLNMLRDLYLNEGNMIKTFEKMDFIEGINIITLYKDIITKRNQDIANLRYTLLFLNKDQIKRFENKLRTLNQRNGIVLTSNGDFLRLLEQSYLNDLSGIIYDNIIQALGNIGVNFTSIM